MRRGRAVKPFVLVSENGPVHTIRLTLGERTARLWLKIERLPDYAPVLYDIELVWRGVQRHQFAHRTFGDADNHDAAIHQAVFHTNKERSRRHLYDIQESLLSQIRNFGEMRLPGDDAYGSTVEYVPMCRRILGGLGRHASLLLAGGVFAGLLLQDLAATFRPLLMPAIGILLFLSVLRLDWRQVLGHARRPAMAGLAAGWQLVVSPVLVWGIAAGIGLPPALVASLVLNAAASPVMSVPALARLLRLDAELSLVVLSVTTVLLPLTLAPVALGLLSRDTAIDPAAYGLRTMVFLIVPMAAGWMVRRVAGGGRMDALEQPLGGLTVIVLLVFAIAVMDGMTARILSEGATVLRYLAAAFALNLGFQFTTTMLFRSQGLRAALSLGLASGNRNMALVMAMTGIVEPDLMLYLAVAQVPIYVSPLLTQRLYARMLRDDRSLSD